MVLLLKSGYCLSSTFFNAGGVEGKAALGPSARMLQHFAASGANLIPVSLLSLRIHSEGPGGFLGLSKCLLCLFPAFVLGCSPLSNIVRARTLHIKCQMRSGSHSLQDLPSL